MAAGVDEDPCDPVGATGDDQAQSPDVFGDKVVLVGNSSAQGDRQRELAEQDFALGLLPGRIHVSSPGHNHHGIGDR